MKKKIKDLTEKELKSLADEKVIAFNKDKEVGIITVKDLKKIIDAYRNGEVDIPQPHILDKKEHDYLRAVCKPYDVYKIAKIDCNSYYQITIFYNNPNDTYSTFYLPVFNKESSMYKGMEPDEHYTIEELELDKEWEE